MLAAVERCARGRRARARARRGQPRAEARRRTGAPTSLSTSWSSAGTAVSPSRRWRSASRSSPGSTRPRSHASPPGCATSCRWSRPTRDPRGRPARAGPERRAGLGELGRRSRAFVERWHDPLAIASASPPTTRRPRPRRRERRLASAAVTAILGLNAFHGDAAAALVVDGELVAAAEEERLQPRQALRRLPVARRAPGASRRPASTRGELDHVAIGRDPRANLGAKVVRTILHAAEPGYVMERLENATKVRDVSDAARGGARRARRTCAPTSTTSSTTSRTPRARSSSRRSRRRRCSPSTASATSRRRCSPRPRQPDRGARARALPALARHLLHGRHAVARLPEVRRRGQGDGPRAVRRPGAFLREDARARPARRAAASSSSSTTSCTTRRAST